MNYREETLTATAWRRCHDVTMSNPLGGPQLVRFFEQEVAKVGERTIVTPSGYIEKHFDPTGQFPLLDPATGLPSGQVMSHAALYLALFSLYMQVATERDAASTLE